MCRLEPEHLRVLFVALNATPALARATICRLSGCPESWIHHRGPSRALARHLGLPHEQMARALAVRREAAHIAAAEERRVKCLGARIVTRLDNEYPQALTNLELPPPVLYLRGQIADAPATAIVGSRRADPYGREVALSFARTLAAWGVVVVSGFARGVDAAAHTGALEAAGAGTVAVLGCGLDIDYPRGQGRLAAAIAGNGAVMSEFPLGCEPRGWHFPIRNRVIAALAAAILVVQATPRSGSLITAHQALDLGREVFAVPGGIFDEKALGPNALIRDGARLAQHPQDILDILPGLPPRRTRLSPSVNSSDPYPAPPGAGGRLLSVLHRGHPRSLEELAAETGGSPDAILGQLLELELAGWVRRHPGPGYERCR